MIADIMTFRRRNIAERRALRLVRGEASAAGYDGVPGGETHPGPSNANLGAYNQSHFGCLRAFARRNGFVILPLDAQFVTSGELVILRWLAEAQRQTGLRTCHFRDLGLRMSLRHCADVLKSLGICLPPHSLHIHTDLDEGPPPPNNASYRAVDHENRHGKDHSVICVATYRRPGRT